jgi:lipopolysaccharide transport system ATP-binding protein
MSSDAIALRARGVGKQYDIDDEPSATTMAEALMHRLRGGMRRDRKTIWALDDVSFDIAAGAAYGIIGRNGAGKSTLLKILSRITRPTRGEIEIRGRVGSLLEVGTGFHPELTGRENIFLNGAILGMHRSEIVRQFDAIVDFAETEKFLDVPVKRYSSGMYVRLAFAVAAHLEPDILIVDEVLAVGDAGFQKKCLGKMGDVTRQDGRTVLLVSHNLVAVTGLCSRGMLLDRGRLLAEGRIADVAQTYLASLEQRGSTDLRHRSDREGDGAIRFVSCAVRGDGTDGPVLAGSGATIMLDYESNGAQDLRDLHVAIAVHGALDDQLFHLSTATDGGDYETAPASGTVRCHLPRVPLQPGMYRITVFATVNRDIADWVRHAGVMEVEAGDYFGSGRLPPDDQGPILVDHAWSLERASTT